MSIHSTTRRVPASPVLDWRRRRLRALGLAPATTERLAGDPRFDLHALLDLVDRGCTPQLAARILAPLDDEARPC